MIQFNLLPDVKLQYVKARKTRQVVIASSILAAGAAFALFIMLFLVVNVAQKQHLTNLNDDISESKNELKQKKDLAKILTVQNQLNSLPALHNDKPVATRTFGYVQQLTPQNASVATVTFDFANQSIEIEGSADSLATVNTFVDTLKFTNFVVVESGEGEGQKSDPALAFSEVVLSDFTVAADNQKDENKAVTYTIGLKYAKEIFNSDKPVELQITKQITTRSETEKPSAVFQAKPEPVAPTGGAQ